MEENMKIEYRKLTDNESAPWLLLTNIDELIWNGVYVLRVTDDDGSSGLPFRFGNSDTVTIVVKDHSHEGALQSNRTIVQTVTYVERATGKVFTYVRTCCVIKGRQQWTNWEMGKDSENILPGNVVEIAWDENSGIDAMTIRGTYKINGERKSSNDGMPILNAAPWHSIDAYLIVLDSSITGDGKNDDKCVTQILTMSNRVAGDGDVYIRSGRGAEYAKITWEPWGRLQQNIEVGQVSSLDTFIDNGIYSGVYSDGSFFETFVMVVINNYAVAAATGNTRSISQFKYALNVDGTVTTKVRKGNGSKSVSWGKWEISNNDEILSIINATETELLKRIQGKSKNSDAVKDPFKFIGNFDGFESLIEKLDTMHNVEGITGSSVHNGHFRALVGSKLVDIVNETQGYAYDVWSQRITCAGIVLRNDVVKTETSYTDFSDDEGHKYRQRRYVQKFVDAVSGSAGFDVKGSVKTFCRRHHLTGDDISTWTPWYDVENPYVQTQNYGKKIALFGASFAQNFAVSGYEFTHEGTSYKLADYIAEKLGAVAFDDYAVGGQGMRCDDNSPFPVHLMNQLKTAQSKGIYDIYIIMGGVNDYWCDKVPLGESTGYASGSSDDEEQNISYCGGLLKAIDYIRLNAPNAKIYTITPFKGYNAEWGWNPRTKIRNAYGNSFYEFVQAQKEVSQVKGVPCLDLWAMQGFSGANASKHYISDLLHPNGNGYYKASEKIVEFVAHGVGSEVVDVQALMKTRISEAVEQGRQLALRSLFVAAGAEYNDGITDKEKTAPWGETVIHKAGHYYLNGLGDITEQQMMDIYNAPHNALYEQAYAESDIRTVIFKGGTSSGAFYCGLNSLFHNAKNIEVIGNNRGFLYFSQNTFVLKNMFRACRKLRFLALVLYVENVTLDSSVFSDCVSLELLKISRLTSNLILSDCVNITKASLVYIINEARPTSAITITLHPDAYARLADDAEIVATLEAQPLVSLVSA